MKFMLGVAAVAASLLLTACDDPAPFQEQMERNPSQAVKVLTTEDGTTLWAFDPPNDHVVYFSTRGTSQSQDCGKNCTREAVVSNTEGGAPVAFDPNDDGTVTVPVKVNGAVVEMRLKM